MPNLNIPLTNLGTDFITILPDGTEYKTTSSIPHMNSIGERKKIKWKFSTTYSNMEGVNLYVQIGLFQQGVVNSPYPKIPINYVVTFPVGLAAGSYPMTEVLPSGVNANLNYAANVKLVILTSSTFNIEVDFFQIYDETQYQNQSFQENHNKLLLDWKQSTSELTIGSNNTCYNSNNSQFAITAKFEKPGVIHAPDTYLYTDNALAATGIPWTAGFYNHNNYADAPYFNTPIWEFTRSSAIVSNLSSSVNTDVLFKIISPSGVSKVLFWIIRTDTFDNTKTMYDNYEANLEEIVSTNANIGASGMLLTTPVNNITSLGYGLYSVGCSLNASNLVNNAKYRMIAVVYYKNGSDFFVNSFISDELVNDSSPCFDGEGFNLEATLSDYQTEFTGNDLECVIEERMKSTISLDFTSDKWKNDILTRLGLTTSNDIRRYLTEVSVSIFDENLVTGIGVIRNLYDLKVSSKYGLLSYSTQPGLTLDFTTVDKPVFTYEWRNRFENTVDCLQTTIDNTTNVIPVYGKQYWGGKTLKIKWKLKFYYDDYILPFEDSIEIFQQIRVKDYDSHVSIEYNDGDGIRGSWNKAITNVCQGEEFCMGIVLNDNTLTNMKAIINIHPSGSGLNAINEAEAWVGDELPQMLSPIFSSGDEDFSTIYTKLAAKFCIDTSKLSVNSYQVSGIAKKVV